MSGEYLAPHSGEREGPIAKQWEGEGLACSFKYCTLQIPRTIHGVLMNIFRGAAIEKVTGMPLTLPALRAGPLPLPATRGEV